jgi:hypothetical protein
MGDTEEDERIEIFQPGIRIGTMILNRMSELAKIMGKNEVEGEVEENMAMKERNIEAELERLLGRLREEVVPEEKMIEVKLEDPILLFPAQHRSFRACRRQPFCPDEQCRSRKKITTLGRLATHLQLEPGATKKETVDLLQYFITRLLPKPIKRIITTRTGETQKGRWNFWKCHYPGCT